jgi:hypothetical protein
MRKYRLHHYLYQTSPDYFLYKLGTAKNMDDEFILEIKSLFTYDSNRREIEMNKELSLDYLKDLITKLVKFNCRQFKTILENKHVVEKENVGDHFGREPELHFIEKEGIFENLTKEFENKLIVALTSQAGFGKSTTASEFGRYLKSKKE